MRKVLGAVLQMAVYQYFTSRDIQKSLNLASAHELVSPWLF